MTASWLTSKMGLQSIIVPSLLPRETSSTTSSSYNPRRKSLEYSSYGIHSSHGSHSSHGPYSSSGFYSSHNRQSSSRSHRPPTPDASRIPTVILNQFRELLQGAINEQKKAIDLQRTTFRTLPYQSDMTQEEFISRFRVSAEQLKATQSRIISDVTSRATSCISQLPDSQRDHAVSYWQQAFDRVQWYLIQATEKVFQSEGEMIGMLQKIWQLEIQADRDVNGHCNDGLQWLHKRVA